jgi:hypothetical protein
MRRGAWRSSFSPELRGYNNRVLWEVHYRVWRRVWWLSWPSSLTSRRSRRRPANSSKRSGRHCRMFSLPDVAFRGPCKPESCVHQRWQGTRRSRSPLNKLPVRALRRPEDFVDVPDPSRGQVQDPRCVCRASLLEGHVASPDPFPGRRRVRGHTCDEVEFGRPELAE